MIKVEWLYWLVGILFIGIAGQTAADRSNRKRIGSAVFWGLLGASFIYGTWVVKKTAPAWLLGIAVIAMAVLAGVGFPGKGRQRTTTAAERVTFSGRFGNRLFVPALVIPVVAVIFGALLTTGYAAAIAASVATDPNNQQITSSTESALQKSFASAASAAQQYPQYASQITAAAKTSFLVGDQWAYLAGIVVILLGALLVFFIFPKMDEEKKRKRELSDAG